MEGLYHKYDVTDAETGLPVNNCFVLRPDKDPAAILALETYAYSTKNAALASDLLEWLQGIKMQMSEESPS